LGGRSNQVKPAAIPIRLLADNKNIVAFQRTLKDLFLGPDRVLTKRYLRLFIEKLVIKLPQVEIFGKTEALLAVLQNRKAVRSPDGVLTAVNSWLPRTCNCKNFHTVVHVAGIDQTITACVA